MICTAALGFIIDSDLEKKYTQLSLDRPTYFIYF